MTQEIYLIHLEDLIAESRSNPSFYLVAELAALVSAIITGDAD